MSVLNGFTVFNFNEGVPYVSVTGNGVTFNKSVVMKLDYPKYVQLLIDPSSRRIALKVCDRQTENSVQFCKDPDAKVLSVRWNVRDLLNTLQGLTGWNLRVQAFKVEGFLVQEERVMIFDLNTAAELSNTK